MSNKENKKVVSLKREYEGYVSLDEYNKLKYDLYLKEKEIENLKHNMNYWYNECIKLYNNQNINNQFRYDLDSFKQMYIEFTKDKNKEIQNKDNENNKLKEQLECVKEETIKLKDNIISDKNKKIQRLEEENNKLNNKIKQIISYYIDGKDIKEIILNLLRINNKDGE